MTTAGEQSGQAAAAPAGDPDEAVSGRMEVPAWSEQLLHHGNEEQMFGGK
jgi:hypothetical protein